MPKLDQPWPEVLGIDPRSQLDKVPTYPPFPALNPKSLAQVRNRLAAPVCDCGGAVSIVNNAEIYRTSFGKWPFAFYCTGCRKYVGLHPFTDLAMGTLANDQTRKARSTCKPAMLDWMARNGYSRTEGYKILAETFEVPRELFHCGFFTVESCQQVQTWCQDH